MVIDDTRYPRPVEVYHSVAAIEKRGRGTERRGRTLRENNIRHELGTGLAGWKRDRLLTDGDLLSILFKIIDHKGDGLNSVIKSPPWMKSHMWWFEENTKVDILRFVDGYLFIFLENDQGTGAYAKC